MGSVGSLLATGQNSTDSVAARAFGSGEPSERLADLRILIVEDEIFVAMAIEDALVSAGAEVIGPVMSVASGMEIMDRETAIDGAILDVNLDDELVFPLAERLRDEGVPIIFHTALFDRTAINTAFPDSIICSKPALNEELVALAAAHFG